MTDEPNYDLSVPASHTAAYVGVKAFLGSIPVAGVGLSEAFAEILASPSQRRRDEVLAMLADGFGRLGIDVEELKTRVDTDASLYDAMAFAIPAAIRTSKATKREALRNAVLNLADKRSDVLDENRQAIALSLVDTLTVPHIVLLREVARLDPRSKIQEITEKNVFRGMFHTKEECLLAAFPEKAFREGYGEVIFSQLESSRLITLAPYASEWDLWQVDSAGAFEAEPRYPSHEQVRPTEFGLYFLRFISEPPELQDSGETPEPKA